MPTHPKPTKNSILDVNECAENADWKIRRSEYLTIEAFLDNLDPTKSAEELAEIIRDKQNSWKIFIENSSEHIKDIQLP